MKRLITSSGGCYPPYPPLFKEGCTGELRSLGLFKEGFKGEPCSPGGVYRGTTFPWFILI